MELTLRPLDLTDIDDFMGWATDEKAARYCSWEPYQDKSEAIKFINDQVLSHPYYRAICVDGRPVGAISVMSNTAARDKCRGELGYVLGSKFWGKGIVTAAVKLVMERIFVEWPELERLEALVDVENFASQRVMEKAGFQREGVLRKYGVLKGKVRDYVMFSFLKTDFVS
ncbi:uncharacterized protein LOC101205310 [Cucumis sativus]|uniref:N-acetyltransferase domain-containing protein n=1 Tax=Cucumis sativus TaxID=3659 RepID=A0A0A0L4R6_CUCSA|nr:uncharacterized protein LOC101205310 [Cucumis sativus]KGN56965.1 hypothetical protein Csa_009996 [Cucumis sativus]